MDVSVFILIMVCAFCVFSIYVIMTQDVKKDKEKKRDFKGMDDSDEMKAKFAEAEKRAQAIFREQQLIIQKNREDQERSRKQKIEFEKLYSGRKPTLDEHRRAIDGVGIEFKVIGMKYRPIEDQLSAKCLDQGEVVLLKPEINNFSNTEAIAVYTTTKRLVGYLPTEQFLHARSLFYEERLPAYVNIPWELDKSWFSVVVPGTE